MVVVFLPIFIVCFFLSVDLFPGLGHIIMRLTLLNHLLLVGNTSITTITTPSCGNCVK